VGWPTALASVSTVTRTFTQPNYPMLSTFSLATMTDSLSNQGYHLAPPISHKFSFFACSYCIQKAQFWFRHTIVARCSPSFILRSFPHLHQRRQTRYFSATTATRISAGLFSSSCLSRRDSKAMKGTSMAPCP
jgi:hypothetical protein